MNAVIKQLYLEEKIEKYKICLKKKYMKIRKSKAVQYLSNAVQSCIIYVTRFKTETSKRKQTNTRNRMLSINRKNHLFNY